ncbi:serine/threonine-protein kinase PknK [Chondromyces crocatus]|uniref:serine/threonine-protein kinase n=1 Tax=Chondromyces crocatus TaxID=52 RepID=UPI0012E274FF|nr:serine/threonine-protein kinase [Chondromyces crocatus]
MTPFPSDPRSSSEGAGARQRAPERTLPSPGQPRPEATLQAVRPPSSPDAPTQTRAPTLAPAEEQPNARSRSSRSARRFQPQEKLGRFCIVSKLGEGGMGVVYKALDLERNHTVALKTLHRISPDSVSRLKNEFRAAVDIAHRNLVLLDELFVHDDIVFFSMELIDGVSFLEHVRDEAAVRVAHTASMSSRHLGDAAQLTTTHALPSEPPPRSGALPSQAAHLLRSVIPLVRIERLRAALRQLAAGVNALHAANQVHRDLKPGNVLVTPAGRVVILDFSLAASLSSTSAGKQDDTAGTPAFMAPEQVRGLPATPATDWYAVGVMLYQALTGRLPYEGSVDQIIKAKRKENPPRPPSALASGVPSDLDLLTIELLQFDPLLRPSGVDVEARLLGPQDRDAAAISSRAPASSRISNPPSSIPISASPSSQAPISAGSITATSPSSARPSATSRRFSSPFIGRETHLAALDAAYRAILEGSSATVYLHGRSGMGKSALVRHFLGDLRQRGDALVLEGRCYERENVPYKAFDSLVDAIAGHLQRLRLEQLALLLPEGAIELARLFPVLHSIETIGAAPPEPATDLDPVELRRRAFRALKRLLRRMGRARPLILWIDDLQWGDRDSAHLLAELLAPPDAPAVLFLGTYRTEEEGTSTFLRELFQAEAPSLDALILEVGALELTDASRLARSLLGEDNPEPSVRAGQIAQESEGSPLFVEELVRYTLEGGAARRAALDFSSAEEGPPASDPPESAVSLEALITARIADLSEGARQLLEVIALAGRPIPQGIATNALGAGPAVRGDLAVLRSSRLVRTRGSRDRDGVEAYHDRIRAAVLAAQTAAARASTHLLLARALEVSEDSEAAEPEHLALHFQGGGEFAKAATYAESAADRAASALAFDRAAGFYQLAVECKAALGVPTIDLASLQTRRADALANAGRCAEAAPIYLAASEGLPSLEAIRLHGRAAEQLLGSGRIGEGVDILAPALRKIGLTYPSTPGRALLLVVGRMLRISVRGRRFRERAEDTLSPEERLRLDLCWWATKGLLSFDSIRAASFLLKYVLLALQSGERRHIARALVFFGMITVYEGTRRGIRKGGLLMSEAEHIAAGFESPYLTGLFHGCRGIAAISAADFRLGLEHLAAGAEVLKNHCNGVRWEVGTCTTGSSSALLWLGEIHDLRRVAHAGLRDAEQIGDLFGIVELDLYCAVVDLAEGDTETARTRSSAAIARWYAHAFTYQHLFALKIELWCDLHEGHPHDARRRLEEAWSTVQASKILRVRLFALDVHFLRGTIALACAAEELAAGRPAHRHLRAADRDATFLTRLDFGRCGALGDLLAAGVLALSGDTSAAISRLDLAIDGLSVAGLSLHAACARRRKGTLLGSDAGRALIDDAEAQLHDAGIADPAAWCRLYAPG